MRQGCVRDPETGRMMKKPASFASMKALLQGAFRFVEFFEQLHREGKVWKSDAADGFRFSLATGEMAYEDSSAGPLIINEFLAPELVDVHQGEDGCAGICRRGRQRGGTALYGGRPTGIFMAVFLFEYFFHTGSPFEGKKMVNRCFLSPLEKVAFPAEQGQFCMDIG